MIAMPATMPTHTYSTIPQSDSQSAPRKFPRPKRTRILSPDTIRVKCQENFTPCHFFLLPPLGYAIVTTSLYTVSLIYDDDECFERVGEYTRSRPWAALNTGNLISYENSASINAPRKVTIYGITITKISRILAMIDGRDSVKDKKQFDFIHARLWSTQVAFHASSCVRGA